MSTLSTMRAAAVLVALAAALTIPASLVYVWANGLTLGGLALWSLPFVGGFALVAAFRPSARARALATIAVLVALDVAWGTARIARPGAAGVRACVDLRCDDRGAFWQRVPDEREATRAGLFLSRLGGAVDEHETAAFAALIDAEYARLPAAWRGLPNALLLRSAPERVESLRWLPPVAAPAKVPCVVFLHGFGGMLSVYLAALARSEIGARFAIVAPALDNVGAWREPRGLAVLERVVAEQLPPEVDRSRVFLVGLSNGAIGATAALALPALRARFAGVALVSGIGRVRAEDSFDGARVLLVTGTRDRRFDVGWTERQANALRSGGAHVEVTSVDADHYLFLTHADEWIRRFVAWERAL